CGTFTGPGKIRAHAARVKISLPGRPHPTTGIQPWILVALILARISTATTPSPAPTRKPCTRSFRTVSESAKRNERTMTKPQITPMSAVRNVYVLLVISIGLFLRLGAAVSQLKGLRDLCPRVGVTDSRQRSGNPRPDTARWIEDPRVSQKMPTVNAAAEDQDRAGRRVVRHRLIAPSRWTHCRAHLRPSIRAEVISPGVRPVVASEEDGPLRRLVVRQRVVTPGGRSVLGRPIRPPVCIDVVRPCLPGLIQDDEAI